VEELFQLCEPSFTLVDDGTLDTILECDNCGALLRFTYAGWVDDDDEVDDEVTYRNFVYWCLDEAAEHECEEEEGN
jgi:hypothetical protein